MDSPYCGWDKNLADDKTAASDFDFLPLKVKEEINKRANEFDSPNNAVERNESN